LLETIAKFIAKEGQLATLRLSSREVCITSLTFLVTNGRITNTNANNENMDEAESKQ